MKSKKFWQNWLKNLDESKLKSLIKDDDVLDELPEKLYKKQTDIINKNLNIKKRIKISEDYNFYKFINYRYAISFSILFIFLITGFLIFFKLYSGNFKNNHCFAEYIKGDVLILNQNKKLAADKRIFENDIITTKNNSAVKLNIGNNSFINLNENSKIGITHLFKDKYSEKTILTLHEGNCSFNVNKKNNKIFFSVLTDLMVIKVTGTDFTVNVIKNEETEVYVKKGEIIVSPVININLLKTIENDYPELANKIKNVIKKDISISSNEKFKLSYKIKNEIESKISDTITEAVNKNVINDKKNIDKLLINISNIMSSINNINKKETINNKDNESYLEILSPEYKYYDSNPLLKYEASNADNIDIYLNNELISINNNEEIKNLNNGFNNIKIIILNHSDIEEVKEIDFFINKLKLSEIDNFNRDNNINIDINNNWYEYEGTDSNNNDINFGNIIDNKIAYKGPIKNNKTWCSIVKEYDMDHLNEILLIIDVNKFNFPVSNNNYVDLAMGIYISDNWHESIDTIIYSKDSINFDFYLKELQIEPELKEFFITKQNNIINLDFSTTKRLLFYKNGNSFYSLILNHNNKILNKIQKINYTPHYKNSFKNFNKIKITCFINNKTTNKESFVEINNFYLYSK